MARFQHEWGFMGISLVPGEGDLVYCPLCDRWQMDGYNDGKPFKLSSAQYEQWHRSGRVDASCNFLPDRGESNATQIEP